MRTQLGTQLNRLKKLPFKMRQWVKLLAYGSLTEDTHTHTQYATKKQLDLTLFILSFGFFCFFITKLAVISIYPGQLEYREGAALVTARTFMDLFNWNNPGGTYVYGPILPLLSTPLVVILNSVAALIGIRIVAILLALFVVFVGFQLCRKLSLPLFHSFIIPTLPLLFGGRYLLGAFPNSFALSFGLLSWLVFLQPIPLFQPKKDSERVNDFVRIAISTLLCFLALLTKPYFAYFLTFILFTLALKRDWACFLFSIGLFISLMFTYYISIYFTQPSLLNNSLFHHINVSGTNKEYAIIQLKTFLSQDGFATIGFGVTIFVFILITIFDSLNRKKMNKRKAFTIFLSCFLSLAVYLIIFYYKTGRHGGAWMSYLYHIIPAHMAIIFGAFAISYKDHHPVAKITLTSSLLLIFSYLAHSQIGILNTIINEQTAEIVKNERIKKYVFAFRNQEMLLSPAVAFWYSEDGISPNIWENGMTEYFPTGFERVRFPLSIIPRMQTVEKEYWQWQQTLTGLRSNKNFELIIETTDLKWATLGYTLCETIILRMPVVGQEWTAKVYVRSPEKLRSQSKLCGG